jgi:hypothetical protein
LRGMVKRVVPPADLDLAVMAMASEITPRQLL